MRFRDWQVWESCVSQGRSFEPFSSQTGAFQRAVCSQGQPLSREELRELRFREKCFMIACVNRAETRVGRHCAEKSPEEKLSLKGIQQVCCFRGRSISDSLVERSLIKSEASRIAGVKGRVVDRPWPH